MSHKLAWLTGLFRRVPQVAIQIAAPVTEPSSKGALTSPHARIASLFALLACVCVMAVPAAYAEPVPLNSADANHYAVLGLGGQGAASETDIQFTAKGTVSGNIGVPANGNILVSGQTDVTGTVYINTAGTAHKSGGATISGSIVQSASEDAVLKQAVSDALAASAQAAAMTGTPTTIPDANTTITATKSGVNVLSISDIILNGHTLTLSAPLGDSFVLNVTGTISLNGASQIVLSGGIRPTDVLINVIGPGTTVSATGGTTANTYCIYGVVLAPQRSIKLTGSPITGELIAGGQTIDMENDGGVSDTGVPSDITSLSVAPQSVLGGKSATGTVSLTGPAPTGGALVSLSSDTTSAKPDSSALIPATAQSSLFSIATTPVSTPTTATITGTYNGLSASGSFTIEPPSVTSVTISPSAVIGAQTAQGTVTLDGNAPTGGIDVLLSSDQSAAVPDTKVTVPAGSNTATFNVNTAVVTSSVTANICGSLNGKQCATLEVDPYTISVNSPVAGGKSTTGTITLKNSEPVDLTFTLSGSNGAATPDSTVTVKAGQTSVDFNIATVPVLSDTSCTITSAYSTDTQSAPLTVLAPVLTLSVNPNAVVGGNPSAATLTLSSPAPAGYVVNMTSSDPSVTLPTASFTVPTGATAYPSQSSDAPITINTSLVATPLTATITGTPPNNNSAKDMLTVNPDTLSLSLSANSVAGGSSVNGTVALAQPVSTPTTVSVSVPTGSPVSLSASTPASTTVVIPADSTAPVAFTVDTIPVLTDTAVTLTAAAGPLTATASLTVTAPTISSLTLNPTTVEGGSATNGTSTGTVTLSSPAPAGMSIALSSDSVANGVTVPSTATVSASDPTHATFTVSTQSVLNPVTATITATLNGVPKSAALTVTPPVLTLTVDAPKSVVGGGTIGGTLTLDCPVPAGYQVNLSSTDPNITFTPSTVTSWNGQTATFTVNTSPVSADETVTVTGTPISGAAATDTLMVTAPTISSLTLNPTTVEGGSATSGTSTGTVTLSSPAPAGMSIALSSDSTAAGVTVPSTATVSASDPTHATFTVSTQSVLNPVTATITATLNGVPKSAALTVTPPVLTLTVDAPKSVVGGGTVGGTLTLDCPVPAGYQVTLTSTDSNITFTPSTVTSWNGQTASFTVNTSPVATNETVTVTGTPISGAAATDTLMVTAPTISSLTLNPTTVEGGSATNGTSTGTITLSSPAPAGMSIALSSDSTAAGVTVPSTATVSASDPTHATFTVSTQSVVNPVTATITATLNGVPKSAALTVTPPVLTLTVDAPKSVVGGGTVGGTLTLDCPVPAGYQVTLTSTDSNITFTPSTVTSWNGQTASFTVNTSPVATNETVTVTGTPISGAAAMDTLMVTAPTISSLTLNPTTVEGGSATNGTSTGTVTLSSPAPAGMSIALSSDSTAAGVTVLSTATVSASDPTHATFTVSTQSVLNPVTATITATLNGVPKSAALTVTPPVLTLTVDAPKSVVGGGTVGGTLSLDCPVPAGYQVTLSSTDPNITFTPSTVTSWNGQTASFTVNTSPVATNETVTVTGTPISGAAATDTLMVKAVPLASVSVSPSPVTGGLNATGTVTLSTVATADTVVTLGSDTTGVSVPANVTVSAGSSTATFPVSTSLVASQETATITATLGGTPKSATLTVNPYQIISVELTPSTVVGTNPSTATVTLSDVLPAAGLTVNVASGSPDATVPSIGTVQLVQNAQGTANSGSFTVNTVGVTASTQATISASLLVGTATVTTGSGTLTITPPACSVSPLAGLSTSASSVGSAGSITGTVALSGAAGAGGEAVNITSSNPSVLNVPASVLVASGATSATFTLYSSTVTQNTNVTVTAVYHGVSFSRTLTVTSTAASGGSTGSGGTGGQTPTATDMVLTPAGVAEGFRLTTVATFGSMYPAGTAVTAKGNMLIGGFLYTGSCYLPTDTDNQTVSSSDFVANQYMSIATADGTNIYASGGGGIAQLNQDGSLNHWIMAQRGPLDIAVDPVSGDIITDTGADINPATGAQRQFTGYASDGIAVSPDGKTAYFQGTSIVGVDIATGAVVYTSPALVHPPDGIAVGGGLLSGKLYTNNVDGTVTEISMSTGTQTVIATNGIRGDLAHVDQTNGTFLLSQGYYGAPSPNGSNSWPLALLRLIPPPGGAFGAAQGSVVLRRDDVGHFSNKDFADNYSPSSIASPALTGVNASDAGFDFTGFAGRVEQADIQRAGNVMIQASGSLDVQLGVQSLASSGPVSYGSALAPGQSLPFNPFDYSSTEAWALPSSFLSDIALGSVYHTELVDRISSACGSYQVTDTPNNGWPFERNALTISLLPSYPGTRIAAGRSLDITMAGTDIPASGAAWDVILASGVNSAIVVGSSGNPNGWDVAPDNTPMGGYIVTVPAAATSSAGYEVRVAGAGSSGFGVTSPGPALSAAQMLPVALSSNPVNIGSTETATVTLDAPAPLGGATVAIFSQTPSVAYAGPSASTGTPNEFSVAIPAGSTSASFPITLVAANTPTVADFLLEYNGYRQVALDVLPVGIGVSSGGSGGGSGGTGVTSTGTGPTGVDGGPTGVTGAPVVVGGNGNNLFNLTATSGNAKVSLSWNAIPNSPGYAPVIGYNVLRSDSKEGPFTAIFRGLTGTTYVDTNVVNGNVYYYVVVAVNLAGPSAYSNVAVGAPLGGIVAAPTITPNGGTFTGSQQVTLSDSTVGAFIYYTTDGSVPTRNSTLYKGPFTLTGNATIEAIGVLTGWTTSDVSSATFVINPITPPTVTPVDCGWNVNGVLASGEPWSVVQGQNYYAQFYSIVGVSGQSVTITATSTAFSPNIYLFDPYGNLVAGASPSSGSNSAVINYMMSAAGTYKIEVTSFYPGVVGSNANAPGGVGAFTLAIGCTSAQAPVMVVSDSTGKTLANGSTFSYDSVIPGTVVTKSFTISNTGNAPLNLSQAKITSTGGSTTAFSFAQVPTSPIAPGQSIGFAVTYTDGTGTSTATLSITDDDPANSPYTLSLTATGQSNGTVGQVPQGGSASFKLGYQTQIPTGGWYILDPSGQVIATSDPTYGTPNNWNVILSGDSVTVTVSAPRKASIANGYTLYVPQGIPNSGTFNVIAPPAPLAPTALTAVPGDTQVALAWTGPSSVVDSYNVYRSTVSGAETLLKSGVTATSYTDTTVTNGTKYYYKVAAVNSGGTSPLSNEASGVPSSKPAAPAKLTATGGDTVVSLAWSPSATATSYNVYRGTASGAETLLTSGVTTASYDDTTVTNGVTYYYYVTGVDAVGEGLPSNEAAAMPSSGTGGLGGSITSPGSVNLTKEGTQDWVYYAYENPSTGGFSLVRKANVAASSQIAVGSVPTTDAFGGASFTWSDGTPVASAASVTSYAELATVGSSITVTVPADTTSRVLKLYVGGVQMNQTAPTGTMTAHLSDGSAPDISDVRTFNGAQVYTLGYKAGAAGANLKVTFTYSAAGAGWLYVQAVDVATGSIAPPSPPTALKAVAGDAKAVLTWTASTTAGVSYTVNRADLTTPVATGLAGTTYTNTGLTDGTTYSYTVTAVNSFGVSTPAGPVTVTPQAFPGQATNLTATGGDGQVVLNWTAGSGATSYNVYRGTSKGGEILTSPIATAITATTFTDKPLTNGSTYYYKVLSVNAVGTSIDNSGNPLYSNEAAGTPVAPPATPTNLAAVPGNAQVTLTWNAVTAVAASASSYVVNRTGGPSPATFTVLAGPDATMTHTDTGLTNGTAYTYTVTAVNAAGSSAPAGPVSATPTAGLVSAPVITAVTAGGASIASGDRYTTSVTVTITDDESGATIFYTTDGSDPTNTSNPSRKSGTSPVTISGLTAPTVTVNAYAHITGQTDSAVSTATYTYNNPPAVTLTAPTTGATFAAGSNITLTATASDTDGTILRVDFYAGANKVGSATSAPYTVDWNGVPAGSYALTAVAVDNDGGQTTSTPAVDITVANNLLSVTPIACSTTAAGTTVSGNLTASSGLSTALGSQHYADDYTFSGTAGDQVVISMRSTAIDSYLTLYDPSKKAVAVNDDSQNETADSQIVYTLASTGTYTIECSTYPSFQTGPYTLSFESSACGNGPFTPFLIVTTPDASGNPQPVASGSKVTFGPTTVNTAVTKTYTMTNTGLVDMVITGLSTTNADFTVPVPANLPPILESGQSLTFTLQFESKDPGTFPAMLSLNNSSSNASSFTLDLSGEAQSQSVAGVAVQSLTVDPATVFGSTSAQGTVTLVSAALTGGQTVLLSCPASPSTVQLPVLSDGVTVGVVVPEGATSATFNIGTSLVASPVGTQVTASSGGANAVASLTVSPYDPVTSINFSPEEVVFGGTTQCTVMIGAPAPANGQLVSLSESSTAASIFPLPTLSDGTHGVIVPQGATQYQFNVTAGASDGADHNIHVTAYTGPSTGTYSQAYGTVYVGSLPVVSITSPASTASAGTVPVTASAVSTISGATITSVQFFEAPQQADGSYGATAPIGTATTPAAGTNNYTVDWPNAAVGTYALTATATDSVGLSATSTKSIVTLSDQPAAPTPTISVAGTFVSGSSGPYSGKATVTIADTNLNAAGGTVVYYTTDGSTPDPSNGTRYTTPFVLAPIYDPNTKTYQTAFTVNAQAYETGDLASPVASRPVTVDQVNGQCTVNSTTGMCNPPTAIITSPADGVEAMGQVPIVGTANGPTLGYWELDYRFVDNPGATSTHGWVKFAQSTAPVVAGTLTTMDTSLMLDGQYDIRLTVFDTDGQTAETDNYVVVKGHQKIGYFTLSYTDMTIPIAGIPISITRTYDSRKKDGGDFGIGWTLSTSNVTVQKPEISTFDWEQYTYQNGFSLVYYVQPVRAHNVTITLPGDMVFSFQETLNPNQQSYTSMADNSTSQVVYQEISGPKATLTPADADGNAMDSTVWIASASDLIVDNKQDPNLGNYVKSGSQPVQLLQTDLTTPWQPGGFILTMGSGVKYVVDAQGNLEKVIDRNGNTVYFSSTDIKSVDPATGLTLKDIQIARSGQYITGITDPNGKTFQYSQLNGDLVSATDRMGNTTTYSYDDDHNLTGIKNALGLMPIRNYYYPDGRLDYTLDAQGDKIDNYYPAGTESAGTKPPAGYGIPVDANGYLQPGYQVVTDALGNPTLAQYDSYGNVTQKTQYLRNADGTYTPVTTTYTFNIGDPNNPDKPTSMVDPIGNSGIADVLSHTTKFSYDANGDTTSTTRYLTDGTHKDLPLVTSSTYNSYGQLLNSQTPLQQNTSTYAVQNHYDNNGNLQYTQDAMGNKTSFSYYMDANGNPTGAVQTVTDALTNTTTFTYDTVSPPGNLVQVKDANGHVTKFGYDANGVRTSMTTTRTNALTGQLETITSSSVPNDSGQITESTAPDNTTTQTFYDPLGRVDYTLDQLKRKTQNQYDPVFGKLTETDYQDGTSTKTQYDADGRAYTSTDRSGRGSLTVYDTLGRVTDTYPLDQSGNKLSDNKGGYVHTHTTYDLNGAVLASTDENGNSSSTQYDSLGRVILSKDALGNATSTQYDADGNATATTDANLNTTTTQYDPDDRPFITTYPDNTYTQVQYDALGRRQFAWDQMRQMTEYHYDALGRLAWVKLPDTSKSVTGYSEQYTYDEFGNTIAQTDANGHTTRMVYDVMGRLIQRILPALPTLPNGPAAPSAQSEYRDYDALGRLWHMTDNNGLVTTFSYDPNSGNMLTKTGSNGDWVSFTYNPDGSIAAESRGNGSTAFNTISNAYDAVTGRLVSVASPNGTIDYAYDEAGNKVETDIYAPNGSLSSKTYYGYDADNRLAAVSHNADLSSPIASYTYDNVGNRASLTRANGVVTTYTYDSLNRLTDLVNSSNGNYTLTGSTGPSFHYTLRADGKRHLVTEYGNLTPGTTDYEYDPDGRLLSEVETLTNGTTLVDNSYVYDGVGNRMKKFVSGVETDYAYDANDRITSPGYSFDADGNQTTVNGQPATYDFENHLVALGTSSNPTAVYSYDAEGDRLSTASSTGTVDYLVDPSTTFATVAEERDGNGNLIARYDYADDLISMTRGTSTWYYVFNGHGDTRALTDASGNVTDTWAYDAFGNIVAPDAGSTPNEFLFNGQQFDAPSGDYFMRARYYAEADGRFLSNDPESGNDQDPITLHRYLYASNDPANIIDASGREGELVGTLTAITIGIAITGSASAVYVGAKDGAKAGVAVAVDALISAVSLWINPENPEKESEVVYSGILGAIIGIGCDALDYKVFRHKPYALDTALQDFWAGFASGAYPPAFEAIMPGVNEKNSPIYNGVLTGLVTMGTDVLNDVGNSVFSGNKLTLQQKWADVGLDFADGVLNGLIAWGTDKIETKTGGGFYMPPGWQTMFEDLAKYTKINGVSMAGRTLTNVTVSTLGGSVVSQVISHFKNKAGIDTGFR